MADRNATLRANLVAQDQMSQTLNRVGANTTRLEKQFTRLSGAVQNAFQFYVRYRIFGLINRGISAVENAIPGLIARGQEWATTVDDISDSSGLAAQKSSLLAGIVSVMTGNAEGLTKALGALSQQAVNHGDVMQRYGIETRNANGELLDTWTILRNVRRATSDLGNGFITTAAARDLFSRGGQTMMDFLTMTDEQFKLLTRDVKESGVIMSEAGLAAADQWGRTQQRFEQQITGIANQITQTVQPLLSKLVDGITNYLRQNMASIVGFVTEVISFVANAIAGFLGIDLNIQTMAEQMDSLADKSGKRERALSDAAKTRPEQSSTEDGYTRALNAQIDAIDRQLAAMAKVDRAEDARREHARLMKDISDAKKELRDLRGEGIFAAGMTAAEAELARQAQAADIIDARKKVKDAQEKLAEQERKTARENRRIELQERKAMLQQRLSDHMKMLAEQAAADREVLSQVFGKDKGGIGGLPQSIQKVMAAGAEGLRKGEIGKKWGEEFRTALEGFFTGLNDPTTGLGATFSKLVAIGDLVARNWELVAIAGATIIGINLANSILSFGTGLAMAAPALLGAGGFLVSVGLAAAAIKMWADAISGWMGQHNQNRQGYESAGAAGTQGERLNNVELQIGLRDGLATGLAKMIHGTLYKGDEEQSLAQSISRALSDKTVTKGELQTYAGKVNELIGLMQEEGRGGETWDELLEQQRLLNAAVGEGGAVPTALLNLGAGFAPGSSFDTAMLGIGSLTSQDGSLAKTAQTSALASLRLAPYAGRTIAQHLNQVAMNTRGLNTNQPWGIANVTLNIDGRTAARLAGIPIRRGNSTTRIQPAV